jgi:hypothetical protein
MLVSCQCGYVQFPTTAEKPLGLYHCHCLDCRAQTASAYGTSAIFPSAPLFPLSDELKEKLKVWKRPAESGNTVECYFCPKCGVRLIHRGILKDGTPKDVISIKGGVVKGLDWKGGIHVFVRSALVEIPADAEKWEAEPK